MDLTRMLDETIRRCEVDGIRKGVEATQQLYPELEPASLEIAGGIARFNGFEALSEAFGIGTVAAVSAEEIALLTAFFESRNSTARVFVTPMSDPSLAFGLARAGYAPAEYENVLVSDDFETYAQYDDRVAVAANLDDWAEASMKGFLGDEAAENGDLRVGLILASSEGAIALAGTDGEKIASTAIMSLRGECAFFFAGATLPEFRRRGWHLALVRDRIARARDAGVRVMRATAAPGSASERNFRRCGFAVLYTRSLWERRAGLSAA
ncbi:MAG TPA: GNAT family N-acetyltransferase [Candidatus Cybelea sp.]